MGVGGAEEKLSEVSRPACAQDHETSAVYFWAFSCHLRRKARLPDGERDKIVGGRGKREYR